MLRKILLSVLFVSLFPVLLFSQSAEIGIFLGTATYKGEISKSLFNPAILKPAVGILFRRNFNNHWAYRLGLNYGSMHAEDSRSKDEYQNRRNLSFRSRTWDGHLLLEFNFLPYQIGNPESRVSPFVFGGFGVYYFNPQALYNDEWYNLQPLGTEGQGTSTYSDRKKYNRIQIALPFGGGFKIKLSRRFGLTVEAGARKLFTDYFDDVSTTYADPDVLAAKSGQLSVILADRSLDSLSLDNTDRQRGNASDNDWYMFAGFTLNYALSKKYYDNCTPFKRKLR